MFDNRLFTVQFLALKVCFLAPLNYNNLKNMDYKLLKNSLNRSNCFN